MALNMKDALAFFVEFERAISQIAPPGVMEVDKRDVRALLDLLKAHSNCEFVLLQKDFSTGFNIPEGISLDVDPTDIASFLLNFGKRAEIVINSKLDGSGKRVVNLCHVRFCAIKEAIHVVLRDEFLRRGQEHPDVANPEAIYTTVEQLIYLPVSILDLDDDSYPDVVKVENYAELLALLLLYPLERMKLDREKFFDNNLETSSVKKLKSTLEFAEAHKVPQRYVNLLFRWDEFDKFYALYEEVRGGA